MIQIPDIPQAVRDVKSKKITRYPCYRNRASSLGYFVPELQGCLRRGVYERTHWEEKELHDVGLQAIFDEGNRVESVMFSDLAEAGINVSENQRPYKWEDYELSGRIEGKVACYNDETDTMVAIPFEFKSMSPNIYNAIHKFEDFKKYPWTRAYMIQITVYMLMEGIDEAIMLLKNKSSGAYKQINLKLDYEMGEWALKAAEAINHHIKAGTMPEKINDRDVCKNCPFKITCLPGLSFGEELKIEEDPSFEEKIDRYLSMKAQAKECKDLYEKTIKPRIKASATVKEKNGKEEIETLGHLNMVLGKYRITGKPDKTGKTFRSDIEII